MMKPRLVLATAPVSLEDRYGKYAAAANTQPSFGVASLAASAIKAGAEVAIVEASSLNLTVEAAADLCHACNPQILGISATSVGIIAAAELARQIKLRVSGIVTVIGGCHASALPERTLREFPEFDLAAVGEGEATISEIIRRFEGGDRTLSDIPGTCSRGSDGIRTNPRRPPIENLDDLPLPAWSLLEGFPGKFKPSPARIMRWPCASVVMTRGCPNACTFCDRSVFGRHCRAYSPSRAADLCEDLVRNYGVREILIEDDTFIINRKTVTAFCNELLNRKLNLSWSCLGRADRVDLELLCLMKKAGCWHISFGIESGDEEILRSVNKNLNLEQISSALEMCRKAGLRTKGFFMVGFPGESERSISATAELVRKLPLDDISVMHLTPFPGSELARLVNEDCSSISDWKSMNALKPVYVPAGMTAEALEQARDRIYRSFFSRPDVLARHAVHALRHPRLIPFYLAGARSIFNIPGSRTT
jgi:radical SAM superfamily enzyme YgiQ (UPF0313 family)